MPALESIRQKIAQLDPMQLQMPLSDFMPIHSDENTDLLTRAEANQR